MRRWRTSSAIWSACRPPRRPRRTPPRRSRRSRPRRPATRRRRGVGMPRSGTLARSQYVPTAAGEVPCVAMAVVIAIDAGTTGVRAFAVDEHGQPAGWSYREFPQYFPRPGWVEHDAGEIWDAVEATLAELRTR